MIGVFSFAILFAINSAVHSYLVVKYAEGNKVAINVGFYYMANAFGRLTGTIISGALYSYVGDDVNDGFAACFMASIFFIVVSTVVTYWQGGKENIIKKNTTHLCIKHSHHHAHDDTCTHQVAFFKIVIVVYNPQRGITFYRSLQITPRAFLYHQFI